MAKTLNRLVWLVFLGIGLSVFFYVPFFVFYQLFGVASHRAFRFGAVVGVILSATVLWAASALPAWFSQAGETRKLNYRAWFIGIIVLGVLMRIGWVLVFPPVQLSDASSYLRAAKDLLEKGIYFFPGEGFMLRSYRPPGYPFFLAAFIMFVGQHWWTPAFTNICFYILLSVAVGHLSKQLAGEKAALLANLLIAFWPSGIAITGLAFTEPLSMLLLMAGLCSFAMSGHNGWHASVLAGVLTGLAALVRPTFLGLPLAWVTCRAMDKEQRWFKLQHTALAVLVMALLILPWTVRNYMVLGAFIPISTNGGEMFYDANNPLATGGYIERGERYLQAYAYDEVLFNKLGYAWGIEWIKENPLGFLRLAVRKQAILLGTDETGVYWALKRGYNEGGLLYEVFWLISNTWWLGVWFLAVLGAIRERDFFGGTSIGGFLLSLILIFVAIHSVYQSQARFHMPFVGVLAVVSALAVNRPKKSIFYSPSAAQS